MESLINPWLIYLAGISESLSGTLGALATLGLVLTIIITIVLTIVIIVHQVERWDFEVFAVMRKQTFCLIPVFVVLQIFSSLVPDRNTLIALAINSQLTPNNITTTGEGVNSLYDRLKQDVVEIIEKSKTEDKSISQ